MNSEIDLKQFETSGAPPGSEPRGNLVSPPKRIISRYVLPTLLVAGFVAVGAVAFRNSFQSSANVMVTMPQLAAGNSIDEGTSATRPLRSNSSPREPIFQAPGWIEPEPYPLVIPALREGTVESIEVIEGTQVSSGTTVAHLVDEDQRLAVASAKSNLALKEARYKAARERWENPTTLRESVETAMARQEKLAAETQKIQELLQLAQVEANVGHSLKQSGYEASLETLRKETEFSVNRNQLAETHAEMRLNSATLHAASERLELRIEDREALESAEAELQEARAMLAMAELSLERSVIRTPTSGTIMRLLAMPGSMLSGDMEDGMSVATMYQPDKLQVRVDVPLAEAAKVRPGLPAEITVEAMPGKKFHGELVNIVPEFDLQKNVLPVKVRIYKPDEALRPEMIARVAFFGVATEPDGTEDAEVVETNMVHSTGRPLLIPERLIINEAGKTTVLIAAPDGIARAQEVTSRPFERGLAIVDKGLAPSDKIITTQGIQAGMRVNIEGFVTHETIN